MQSVGVDEAPAALHLEPEEGAQEGNSPEARRLVQKTNIALKPKPASPEAARRSNEVRREEGGEKGLQGELCSTTTATTTTASSILTTRHPPSSPTATASSPSSPSSPPSSPTTTASSCFPSPTPRLNTAPPTPLPSVPRCSRNSRLFPQQQRQQAYPSLIPAATAAAATLTPTIAERRRAARFAEGKKIGTLPAHLRIHTYSDLWPAGATRVLTPPPPAVGVEVEVETEAPPSF